LELVLEGSYILSSEELNGAKGFKTC